MAQTHTPEESIVVKSHLLLTLHTISKCQASNNPQMGDFVVPAEVMVHGLSAL